MLYLILKVLFGPIILLSVHKNVYGRNSLRIKGKAIFISNHISMMDPILLAAVSPRNIRFMAKKELFKSKLSNLLFRSLLAFPVNRKSVDMQSLRKAMKVLSDGKVFGIFPEGKRAVTDDMDEFENGAAFLAIRTGAPVIPIYIHPDTYRWRPCIMVGQPININDIVANVNKSDLVEVATNEFVDAINSLRAQLEAKRCR